MKHNDVPHEFHPAVAAWFDAAFPGPTQAQKRAWPLIQLLTAAAAQGCDVMWEKGAPPV